METVVITDYDLQALIDGQADDILKSRIVEAINNDPVLYNRYILYEKQKKLLKTWWKDH